MLDLLIQTILGFLDLFKFWVVVAPYAGAVRVRLGKEITVLSNGFHWIIPFGIDHVLVDHIVPTTHSLGEESITTRDGKSVTFHAVVTYKIHDIEKALLQIENADHAVRDACSGECGRILHENTWEEILDASILEKLTKACRKRGFQYGIEIIAVQLAGLAIARNIRIMQK
jgi:regulator of protease activity HflC (stomatin/prohibitin superfamily)